MTVYAVIATKNPEPLRNAVVREYGANRFDMAANVWMISDVVNARGVSDKLGLTGGGIESEGVVVAAGPYFGYARADLWTWLQQFPDIRANG